MSRARALVLLVAAGCGPRPELTLAIRVADDPSHLLATVSRLDLIATRDTEVLAQASFATPASYVSVAGVSHGPHTVVTLEGFSATGDLRAVGKTCAIDFQKSGTSAPLYFAPTNFFAKTGSPAVTRGDPIVVPLDDGSVLLAGGSAAAGALASVERYFPGSASFSAGMMTLSQARAEAETLLVPGFGALITGGIGSDGQPLPDAEIYDASVSQFMRLTNPALQPRVEHRAVLLPNGRVLVSGGRSTTGTLDTSAYLRLSSTTMQVLPGPPLATARRDHAVAVASDVPVVFGGYGSNGAPLASIETLFPSGSFATIADLQFARAEATASLLPLDGQILVVGGAGDGAGTPRSDSELFNPLTRTTTVFPMSFARRGHTATVLPDGRVLVIGGLDGNGQPQSTVELFVPGAGFVIERPLNFARAHHVAVPLCDGTVLVVGGADGAELYTPPPT